MNSKPPVSQAKGKLQNQYFLLQPQDTPSTYLLTCSPDRSAPPPAFLSQSHYHKHRTAASCPPAEDFIAAERNASWKINNVVKELTAESAREILDQTLKKCQKDVPSPAHDEDSIDELGYLHRKQREFGIGGFII
ncbi:hypothetical protein TIFTF001_002740 [Ficus carica]|uniref:Uncharacterized protein n=1 Tax=Ficus carica TaxID=3494 RepID=A0AA87Z8Y4_FICCA|nr:hypothetical protein TIFTF001_002740 [Ficus carica]